MSLAEMGGRKGGFLGSSWTKPAQSPAMTAAGYMNDSYDARSRLSDQYLNSQLGWQNQGYGQGQQSLQSGYGFDTARLGLEQQALGVDRGAVGRQSSYYDKLFGVDTERYQRGVAFNNQLKDFRSTDYGSTLHDLRAQASQVRNKAGREDRDMRRAQTAGGAFTSEGSHTAAKDIKDDRDYALTGIDIARKQATTSFKRDQAGYDNTIANLTSDFTETGLNHGEQQARLRDRMSTLDIESKKLGISGDELSSQLAQGLAKLKLDHTVSVGALLDALNQNAAGRGQNALQNLLSALGL